MKKWLILILSLLLTVPALAEMPDADALLPWGETPADIPAPEGDALADALNAPGGELTFAIPEGVWPMVIAGENEQVTGVTSTNVMQDDSISAVSATFDAKKGDALAITFRMSSEKAHDRFIVTVNGDAVKVFSGEQAQRTWAYGIPADGEYTVVLAYVKDGAVSAGEDSLLLDEVALLTGVAAEAALTANPSYPLSNANRLMTAGNARDIGIEDPTFALTGLFGLADYCIAQDTVTLTATLAAGADPEGAFITGAGEDIWLLSEIVTDGAYTVTLPVAADAPYTLVQLHPELGADMLSVRQVVVFPSEESVAAFIESCKADGISLGNWWYAESTEVDP